jgi:feruloyl esterase
MRFLALGLAALAAVAAAGAAEAQVNCEAMKGLVVPDVRITNAVAQTSPVASCKLSGVIGRETTFFVVLPEAWNGKFVMGGQGGYAGNPEESQALQMNTLQRGYAVAGTNTGHTAGGTDGSWALGEMGRIVDYAHLAIHRVTETAKAAIRARYGRAPERSYFAGCSNGGREALMAAQRWPSDFDGILAGAPALNFQGITATFITVTQRMYPNPQMLSRPVLDKPDREALGRNVLASCDAQDGLTDGVLSDPMACRYDARAMACRGANTASCLSREELAAVDAIRNGPQLNGRPYHVGFPWGGEGSDAGWGLWLAGRENGTGPNRPSLAYSFGFDFMRYFVKQDPNWTYLDFNLAALAGDMRLIQATVSPNNPDLSAFRGHGGKLLMYHGWADSALSPLMSTGYVDSVYARDATARGDVRLFMMPGVMHCAGGPGPDRLDGIGALDAWVNGGAAPDELPVSFAGQGARKLCAYPNVQRYRGTGDGRSPDQFSCEAPR